MDSQGEGPKQQGSMPPSSRGSLPPGACLSQRRLLGCTTCGVEHAPGIRQIFQFMKQYMLTFLYFVEDMHLSVEELAKIRDGGGLPRMHSPVHGVEVGDPVQCEKLPFVGTFHQLISILVKV